MVWVELSAGDGLNRLPWLVARRLSRDQTPFETIKPSWPPPKPGFETAGLPFRLWAGLHTYAPNG
jgi:hypothetical protein